MTKALDAPARAEPFVASTGTRVRGAVADIVEAGVDELVEIFYSTVRED
jgi:hypothetical protein